MADDQQTIKTLALEDVMEDRFGRYSKYIIQDRALPDARDGCKPVQRRILYAMYSDGNTPDKPYRKSAKTVGLVIGNYHPHGDSSVYEAMVRLSQPWKMNIPLVDMQGNNGSIDDDPAAAMRYTEARLSAFAQNLLTDIDEQTVPFTLNFDDTTEEPTVLPAGYPQLLVNGATGISAGYATNIPPHNLGEIIDATIYRMNTPFCTLDEIMEICQGPDFPTGAIVQGEEGIKDYFATGKGKVIIRSKLEVKETKTIKQIVITEIPYEVVKANMVRKLDDIRLNKTVDGILDVRDESDRNGLRIVIDLRKETDANLITNVIYKSTDLQVAYNINMVAIVHQRPVQLGIFGLLDAYITHRKDVVLKRSQYRYAKMESRLHILEGLMKAVSILDEIIAIIRSSKDKGDAKTRLCEAFDFSDAQAEAIVTLRLYRLTNTDIFALREEFALLINEMEYLKTIIDQPEMLRSVIVKELRDIKEKFAIPRRSVIEKEVSEIVIDKLSMITNERVVVTVSRDGYLKRVSMRSKTASEGLTGLKEGDKLIGTLECDTLDTLVLITRKGNYAYLPVYQIDEAKYKEIGAHLNQWVKGENEDKIVGAFLFKDFHTYQWIVTVSKDGFIKKTPAEDWVLVRNSKVSVAMTLSHKSEIVSAFLTGSNDDVLIISEGGYLARYGQNQIPSVQCKSKGVKALNLASGDAIAYACKLAKETDYVAIISEKGLSKRFRASEVTRTNRPVKGELVAKKVKSNPQKALYLLSGSVYDSFVLLNGSTKSIMFKDVPIMAKDATYSSALPINGGFSLIKGIEEAVIIDIPVKAESSHLEMMALDLEE
ncbi:MAG: DNA topoisomerase IV subunit A [Firmicutes bacterium HGW-Firmicutes-10]|jgi:topoisomerase-4 subunit A|nr:MAG: DNA topoisomerase IV subunit A [Firmicutes bacterium HGW-Firmicutes-10]